MDIDNWRDLISEAQHVDVEIDYDGIYDAHLRAQQIKGADAIVFHSEEMIRHEHRKRKISNNRRVRLPDENIDVLEDKQGGGSGPSKNDDNGQPE